MLLYFSLCTLNACTSRECLCLVVKAKMDIYETERSENQEMEEYLKNFLDNEVKTLWPKGWMQPR